MTKVILQIPILLASACSGGAGFSGGTTKQELVPEESKEETAQNEASPSKNSGETSIRDSRAAETKKDPTKTPTPRKGVVKGSFTAWTEPERPASFQNYTIVIEVKLPNNVQNYVKGDLSGLISGTDGYQRVIEGIDVGDSFPEFQKRFENYGTTARLFIPIPGAHYMVRDRISIKSTLLNEAQTIEIIFGSS